MIFNQGESKMEVTTINIAPKCLECGNNPPTTTVTVGGVSTQICNTCKTNLVNLLQK